MATVTKLKAGIIAAIVVAGVATPLVIQHQAQVKLAEKDSLLRQQSEQLAQLVSESQRLSNLLAQASPSRSLPSDQLMELLRLRSEVGALRQQARAGTAVATAASADYWPRDSWNFVGYVSPAAALQSYFWAASKGDVESFRATITGDAQKSMELQPESIAQAFVSAQVAGLKSVRVLHREVQADDTVVLTTAFEKETGNEVRSLLMKKVGTEWKFSAYINN